MLRTVDSNNVNSIQTKECSFCAETIPLNATVCGECGSNLPGIANVLPKKIKVASTCSACSASLPAQAKFCNACGIPCAIVRSSAPPPVQIDEEERKHADKVVVELDKIRAGNKIKAGMGGTNRDFTDGNNPHPTSLDRAVSVDPENTRTFSGLMRYLLKEATSGDYIQQKEELRKTQNFCMGLRDCPFCMEPIHINEQVCKKCHLTVPELESSVRSSYAAAGHKLTRTGLKAIAILMSIFGIVLAFVLVSSFLGPAVSIRGDTGTIDVTILSYLSSPGHTVAEAVYKTAVSHKELKEIVVNCIMSKVNLTDRYGKDWDNDRAMGSIEVSNLDEVRKYKGSADYAYGDAGAFYQMQLSGMNYGNMVH